MNGRAAAIAAWVAVGLVGMAADANADGDAGRGHAGMTKSSELEHGASARAEA